ncbi:hypothetical protein ACIBL6_09095 [Streptomyces sp. NPDC050400]|uniref:hypothetical protein n=1 Tax=Streptomyces sp. NPDC050400 TaxID=3365610 RepID=UPI0037B204C9
MSTYRRRAALLAVPAVLVAVLSGCSSDAEPDARDAPQKVPTASTSDIEMGQAKKADGPPDDGIPSVLPGGRTMFKSGATAMTVAVGGVEYIDKPTDEDFMTTGDNGQFLRLRLTVMNTGKTEAEFSAVGVTWESDKVAEQSASTLGSTNDLARLSTTYKPGQGVTGSVILDAGSKGGTVSFYDAQDTEAPAFKVVLPSS